MIIKDLLSKYSDIFINNNKSLYDSYGLLSTNFIKKEQEVNESNRYIIDNFVTELNDFNKKIIISNILVSLPLEHSSLLEEEIVKETERFIEFSLSELKELKTEDFISNDKFDINKPVIDMPNFQNYNGNNLSHQLSYHYIDCQSFLNNYFGVILSYGKMCNHLKETYDYLNTDVAPIISTVIQEEFHKLKLNNSAEFCMTGASLFKPFKDVSKNISFNLSNLKSSVKTAEKLYKDNHIFFKDILISDVASFSFNLLSTPVHDGFIFSNFNKEKKGTIVIGLNNNPTDDIRDVFVHEFQHLRDFKVLEPFKEILQNIKQGDTLRDMNNLFGVNLFFDKITDTLNPNTLNSFYKTFSDPHSQKLLNSVNQLTSLNYFGEKDIDIQSLKSNDNYLEMVDYVSTKTAERLFEHTLNIFNLKNGTSLDIPEEIQYKILSNIIDDIKNSGFPHYYISHIVNSGDLSLTHNHDLKIPNPSEVIQGLTSHENVEQGLLILNNVRHNLYQTFAKSTYIENPDPIIEQNSLHTFLPNELHQDLRLAILSSLKLDDLPDNIIYSLNRFNCSAIKTNKALPNIQQMYSIKDMFNNEEFSRYVNFPQELLARNATAFNNASENQPKSKQKSFLSKISSIAFKAIDGVFVDTKDKTHLLKQVLKTEPEKRGKFTYLPSTKSLELLESHNTIQNDINLSFQNMLDHQEYIEHKLSQSKDKLFNITPLNDNVLMSFSTLIQEAEKIRVAKNVDVSKNQIPNFHKKTSLTNRNKPNL